MKKLAGLLSGYLKEQSSSDSIADWARPQQDKNVWGLLAVIRLFLLRGSVGTQVNQRYFWQTGLSMEVMEVAFHPSIKLNIKSEVIQAIIMDVRVQH